LDQGGAVLGVMEDWQYEDQEICLNSGDRILMYTDGITECCNAAEEEFGEERLAAVVESVTSNADALTAAAIDSATDFSNGRFGDDVTVVAITVQ
jgi:sigma-B regulation protein RsbU (phosphoserine phosphatase)